MLTSGRAAQSTASVWVDDRAAPASRTVWRALAVAAVLVLALGAALHQGLTGGRPSVSAMFARPHGFLQKGLLGLPLAAQGPVSAALGDDIPAYRLSAGEGGFRASNPAQQLSSSFTSSAVSVSTGATFVGLSLRGVGYGSALRAVGAVPPRAQGNRVVYTHAGLSEWYVNGPLGLEQGFALAHAPARHSAGPLTLSITLSGNAHAALAKGGQTVTLTRAGKAALRYTGLHASDALGHPLRIWLQLRGRRLLLRIDASDARYPLRIDPLIQVAELTASDGALGDFLGISVAVSGNTVVAGAPAHDINGQDRGAVYVFEKPSGGWANATQTAELTASDGAGGDWLGGAVAVSGNTVVAGAYGNNVGPHVAQGAVYVFEKPGTGWANATQTAELTASDGAEEDYLGWSVAVSGNTVVAGALNHNHINGNTGQGAAYVFERPSGAWANATQTAELTASDGAADNYLGESVGVSGNTVVAGARGHEVGSEAFQGAAYVFEKPGTGWVNATQTAELTASDGAAYDGLGQTVAVSGNTIVAGSDRHTVGSNRYQGAVYVFEDTGSGWTNATQTAELTASDGVVGDQLGASLAVSGNTVVAGAPGREVNGHIGQGDAYVFEKPSGGWVNANQTEELTASNGAERDVFGASVAVSGDTVVVGQPDNSYGSQHKGTVYVFTPPPPPAPTVVTGSASQVTQTSATLNGTVNPNGSNVTSCEIEYSTSPTLTGSTVLPCSLPWPGSGNTAVAVSASPGGLSPLTTYYFRVVADDANGTSYGSTETFTTPGNPPHWYSNGKLIGEGQQEPVKTRGMLTLYGHGGELQLACKVKDTETIENPVGGGGGRDTMVSFAFSDCHALEEDVCPPDEKIEVLANPPWRTELLAGPPVRDEMFGMELKIVCTRRRVQRLVNTLTGSLTPEVGNSSLEFGAGSGALAETARFGTVELLGTDTLTGPRGDRTITARTP